jgi:hypothetical protein
MFGLEGLAHEQLDSAKPPEDQVAVYLYKLRGKFRGSGQILSSSGSLPK